jgi:hypothetical protein
MIDVGKDIVKGVDAIDMVGGTLAKPLVEKVGSGIVGNGTIMSGAAKIATAFIVAKYGGNNRIGKSVAIGAGMDGAEDMVIALTGKVGLESADTVSGGVF